MKIAICISGELRNFDNINIVNSLYSFISNLEKIGEVDLYLSTWSHIGDSYNLTKKDIFSESSNVDLNSLKLKISQIYKNLIDYEIENFDTWLSENQVSYNLMKGKLIGGEVITSPPQLYKIYKCNQLKNKHEIKEKIKYDLVIRTRPDLFYFKLNENEVQNLFTNNLDQINHINFGIPGAFWPNRVFDIFFFSNDENMNIISSTWNNLLNFVNDDFDNGLDKKDCCRLLYVNCLNNNIKVNDLKKRICAVYRGEDMNFFHEKIKQYDKV
jgi:hypothetical protein